MVNRSHAVRPRRWGTRALVRLVVLTVVVTLFTIVLTQLWAATRQDLSVADAERQGVAYLRPLVHLTSELTDAQSVAVHNGQPAAARLSSAVAAVDAADRAYGGALGAHQRWTDLRARVTTVTAQHPTGDAAYDAYSEVVTLTVDLGRKVGDTSNLILDPNLDSYYLMDTALLRLPD